MNSERDKIRIDTTEDEKNLRKNLVFSKLKKFFSLVVFIYCCLVPILFEILGLTSKILIKIFSKNNSDLISPKEAFLECLTNLEKEENETKSRLGKGEELCIDCEEQICNKWKDEIELIKDSFSKKVRENEGFYETEKLDLLLKELTKKNQLFSKGKNEKLKRSIIKELNLAWEDSYIPEKQCFRYNKKTKEWETRKIGNIQLVLDKPTFFFSMRPIKTVSEKIISLTGLNKESNYNAYFHADIIIKSFIINFIVKKILDFFSEEFFDKKKEPILFFLAKPMIWIFFIRIASKDVLLNKLPLFWQKRKNWEIQLIFTSYEILFLLLADYLKATASKDYSNLLLVTSKNISNVVAREFTLRIIGIVSGKREMISFFFMYRLIPHEVVDSKKETFPELKIKDQKIEIDHS